MGLRARSGQPPNGFLDLLAHFYRHTVFAIGREECFLNRSAMSLVRIFCTFTSGFQIFRLFHKQAGIRKGNWIGLERKKVQEKHWEKV